MEPKKIKPEPEATEIRSLEEQEETSFISEWKDGHQKVDRTDPCGTPGQGGFQVRLEAALA